MMDEICINQNWRENQEYGITKEHHTREISTAVRQNEGHITKASWSTICILHWVINDHNFNTQALLCCTETIWELCGKSVQIVEMGGTGTRWNIQSWTILETETPMRHQAGDEGRGYTVVWAIRNIVRDTAVNIRWLPQVWQQDTLLKACKVSALNNIFFSKGFLTMGYTILILVSWTCPLPDIPKTREQHFGS